MPVLDVTRSGLGRLLRRNMLQIVTGSGNFYVFVSKRLCASFIFKQRSAPCSCALIMVLDTLVSAGCRVAADRHDLVTSCLDHLRGVDLNLALSVREFLFAATAHPVSFITVLRAGRVLCSNRLKRMLAGSRSYHVAIERILAVFIFKVLVAAGTIVILVITTCAASRLLCRCLGELAAVVGGVLCLGNAVRLYYEFPAGFIINCFCRAHLAFIIRDMPFLEAGCRRRCMENREGSIELFVHMHAQILRIICGSHDCEHTQQHGQHQKDAE